MLRTRKPNAHSDLVKQCLDLLNVVGWAQKIGGGIGMKPGMPDIIASIPVTFECINERNEICDGIVYGQFLAVEVKTGKAKLSSAQREVRYHMEEFGAVEYVEVRQLEDLATVLTQLTGRRLELT